MVASTEGTKNGISTKHPSGNVYVIRVLPPVTPVTIPVGEIAAMPGLLIDQVPPAVASESCNELFLQTVACPAIVSGAGFTVSVAEVIQPEATVYTMVTTPGEIPVTWPIASIVAMEVLLELHVPPVVELERTISPFEHKIGDPVIGARGFTLTGVVRKQPLAIVYVIVAMPDDIPETIPDGVTVAMFVLLLAQVPPAVASLRAIVCPVQMLEAPIIGLGAGFTITVFVVEQPVGKA
jgi:hypothetical protein